jgi:hypothetical protein
MPSVQCQLFKLIMPLLRRVQAHFPTQDLKAYVRCAAWPCATTPLPAWR